MSKDKILSILSKHSNNYNKTIEQDGKPLFFLQVNGHEAIKAMEEYSQSKIQELEKENERLKKALEFKDIIYKGETKMLRDELLKIKKENNIDPYWYWPQCDVDGCEGVSCRGGGVWEETGYWNVCPDHSDEFRNGKPQPKMKQSSIEREASRDKKTGCLPTIQRTK